MIRPPMAPIRPPMAPIRLDIILALALAAWLVVALVAGGLALAVEMVTQ